MHTAQMAEQTFDARRIAREQEGRLAAASAIGFNALKPIMEFQVSLLRRGPTMLSYWHATTKRGLKLPVPPSRSSFIPPSRSSGNSKRRPKWNHVWSPNTSGNFWGPFQRLHPTT